MADEFLEVGELRALRLIGDRLLVGPPGRREALLQVGEVCVRHVDAKREDCGVDRGRRAQRPGKYADGTGSSRRENKIAPCRRKRC